MRTLEDRLTRASDEARRQVDQVDIRQASTVGRRVHQRRALAGAAAVALVFGAFGTSALLVGSGDDSRSAVGAGETAPSTTDIDSTVPTTVPVVPPAVANDELPRFGVTGGDWAVIEAIDADTGTVLMYEGDPDVYGGEAGEPRLGIEVWSEIPGEDAGSGYQNALANLISNEESLDDVTVVGDVTAKAFTFTDPNTGISGFYFLWQHSDSVAVEVIVYLDSFDQAKAVMLSIVQLPESSWDEILDGQPSDASMTTTTVAPSVTTTSVWPVTTTTLAPSGG